MIALAGLVAPAVARADDSLSASLRYLRDNGRDDYPFVGSTKAMTIAINTRFRADTLLHATTGRGWACTIAFNTTLIVSWRCQDDAAHRGQELAINAAYEIVNDMLKPLTFDAIFRPGPARDAGLAKLKGDLGKQDSAESPPTSCTVPATRAAVYLTSSWGLEVLERADSPSGCFFWYPKIVSLIDPQSRIGIVAGRWADGTWNLVPIEQRGLEPDEPGYIPPVNIPPGKTLPTRFVVVDKDSVRDTGTGLIWASHDNGADLDADDAITYAKAYRGGGHADWRLPTYQELTLLATEDLAHREPKDCTGGKSNYVITPLIHLSCGLAWSINGNFATATAFGFISGTTRESKRSETKNYRALPVRRP
jgi:hypothetical protein